MWIPDAGQELPNTKHSRQLVAFTCSCRFATKKTMPWKNFGNGHSKSCGRCQYIVLGELVDANYGKLAIDENQNDLTTPVSHNHKATWRCACGGAKAIVIKSVLNGLTKSCGCALAGKPSNFVHHSQKYLGPIKRPRAAGKIKLVEPDWWLTTDFGKLKVTTLDRAIGKWSEIKLNCVCKCGNTCRVAAKHLAHGLTESCGRCAERGIDWWSSKSVDQYPADLESFREFFVGSYLEPQEFNKKHPAVKCLLCSKIFHPGFHDLFLKKIVSCGCVRSAVSKANREIGAFVESLGLPVVYEHAVGSWKVDVYVSAVNLVIEYYGLRYHSDQLKKRSIVDLRKFKSVSQHCRCMIIYQDEWDTKKEIFRDLITSACGRLCLPTVRPKTCEIELVGHAEAARFLNDHHYIGAAGGTHIGLRHNRVLAAVMTIARPTRQSQFDFEITRMVSARMRIHGGWSFILSRLPDFGFRGSIVTFSDNRLSDGRVYQAMGMHYDGPVAPDYYYTNNRKRFHKSGLRKTAAEKQTGLTEREIRASQGYYRIFDVGKKRWTIKI